MPSVLNPGEKMVIGFSTRLGGVSPAPFNSLNMSISRGDEPDRVAENRRRFLNGIGISAEQLASPVQVSRDQVLLAEGPGKYPAADALVTVQENVFLSVLTADCSPVMFWSTDTPLVAAVHSGWQGSELNILGRTLDLAARTAEFSKDSLHMVIGPGLTQTHFEVGPEFMAKFPKRYLKPRAGSDRYEFDNNAYLRDTAIQWGLNPEHIEIMPYCSYQDEPLFFSHRRDKGKTGRMMSVIGIRS